jgi:hypothetical protein
VTYINTDDCEQYHIKHGVLTESPVRGSTARFISNPIVDDIEADPDPKGRARRRRINGRIVIDTTVPEGTGERYQPPSCLVIGEPSVNNLAIHRWRDDGLSKDKIEAAKIEAELIRRIKDGAQINALRPGPWKPNPGWEDQRAFRQLLEAFQRTVVKPAGKYVPGGTFSRRQPENQKHTNDLLYEDLTSVACFALWQSTLKFDPARGYRLSTLSRRKIVGAIRNEANYLRQGGYTTGDTVARYLTKDVGRRTQSRLDRWIFSHLGSPPEELLKAQRELVKRPVFRSLQEAAEALQLANNLEHPAVYSGGDRDNEREDDPYATASKPDAATAVEWRDVCDSHDPLKLSPQLQTHRRVSELVDFWVREFCDPPRIKSKPQAKPVYKPCAVSSPV